MDKQMATEDQVKKIFAIVADRNISDFLLRKMLSANYIDVHSPRDLSFEEAERCIEGLKQVDITIHHDKRPITSRQIKKLHTLKSALNKPDHLYRWLLAHEYGVYTSKDLNYSQAQQIIDRWEALALTVGAWEKSKFKDKYNELEGRPGMATPLQLRMIEGIWDELYPESDEKTQETHLRRYLSKFFKVSDMRFLDADLVNKVLFALKTMQARKEETPENAPETHCKGKAV